MGANVYLDSVTSVGYDSESAATIITADIQGKQGKRIAIRAAAFSCGGTATTVYFMQALGSGTTSADAASGASQIVLTAEIGNSGNSVAANDILVVVQDNGTYLFSKCRSVATLTMDLCTVLTGAAAAGATVYDLGIQSDEGHLQYRLATSSQTARALDGGFLYADAKGYPMRVHHANDAAAAGSIDYVTVDYINR